MQTTEYQQSRIGGLVQARDIAISLMNDCETEHEKLTMQIYITRITSEIQKLLQ